MDKHFDKVDARLDRVDMRLDLVESQAAERHAEPVGEMNRVNAVDITVAQWGTSVTIQNGRDLRFDARHPLVEGRLEIRDDPGA